MSYPVPSMNTALLSLARWQLSIPQDAPKHVVPDDYLDELEKHVSLYPGYTNFVISPQPGYGLGYVTCLEHGCSRTVVKLIASINTEDGGLSRGYGSLASYRVHIVNFHSSPRTSVSPAPVMEQTRRTASMPQRFTVDGPFANVKQEPEASAVMFEPIDPTRPRKRRPDFAYESHQKRFKIESIRSQWDTNFTSSSSSWHDSDSAYLRDNSPASSSSFHNYTSSQVYDQLSDIQSEIISTRRLLENVQRKPFEHRTASDTTREVRLSTLMSKYEANKESLKLSLRTSNISLRDNHPLPPQEVFEPPIAQRYFYSPEQDHMIVDPSSYHSMGVASGSNVVLDVPFEQYPRTTQNTIPISTVARDDDVKQFLITAGNAVFFDGKATLEDSLASLGLRDPLSIIPGMTVSLMPHQVLSLDWMIQQEKKPDMNGGCLADEMGLGKTVQMIALMVKKRSNDPNRKMNLIVAPLALLDQWQHEIEMKTNCEFSCYVHHGQGRLKNKSDLEKYDIVLTTYHTLASEWPDPEAQLKKKDNNGSIEETFKKRKTGLLHQIEWYRIILDEAHLIRNRNTQGSRVVTELGDVDTYRWCLTGTPVMNELADSYSLLRFLRIHPWCDWQEFNCKIARKEKRNPTLATSRLQSIFRTMLLRRMKDTVLHGKRLVELPRKTVDIVRLDFSQEERDIYQMIETKSQAIFNKFLAEGTVLKNYTQVLEMLLRLRQVCSHPSLITHHDSDGIDLSGGNPTNALDRALKIMGPEFVRKVVAKLRESSAENSKIDNEAVDGVILDEECPICFDILTDSVVTECIHIFCRECIGEVLNSPAQGSTEENTGHQSNDRPCPVCRCPILKEKLFARKAFERIIENDCVKEDESKERSSHDDKDILAYPSPESNDVKSFSRRERANAVALDSEEDAYNDIIIDANKEPSMSLDDLSTKMQHMMFLLNRWRRENPDDKIIIISQWTTNLEIVSKHLSAQQFTHVKYQGSMSRKERNRAVRAFMAHEGVMVMLLSLRCGGMGLNLTRANRVISLDLSWSFATEEQAFDRVHRLGQQREVFVERLVIADTVEDRILALQNRKKDLSDSSLGEGKGKKLGRLNVKELANLFGLDHRGQIL